MKDSLVSVVIPAYNVQNYINKTVSSILEQDYPNIELIIVNDGSDDNTLKIIEDIKKNNAQIKIINKKNGGVSSARNYGIDYATGEYITFVDGDDYVASDYVSYLVSLIKKTNADFAFSENIFSSKRDKQVKKEEVRVLDSINTAALLMSTRVTVGSWNKIYNLKFLNRYHIRFNEKFFYGEGLSFIMTVAQRAKQTVVGNRLVYFYRKNNLESATTKFDMKKIKNGISSIQNIKNNLIINDLRINRMINLHLSVYYLGALVNLINYHKVECYKEEYVSWLRFIRKNLMLLLLASDVSLYRKGMLLVGSISPYFLAKLDVIRRKNIIRYSI